MKIKLTENDINKMVINSVKKILKENNNYDREYIEWINSEKNLLEELSEFLKKNGIKSAHVGEYSSGLPCLMVYTDEYHEKRVSDMVEKFAETKGRYATYNSYPATTYIKLHKMF